MYAIDKIVLLPGTYGFADSMCSDGVKGGGSKGGGSNGGSALCISRNVTIEAEVAGSVVLKATGATRVFRVSSRCTATLIGLTITGGSTNDTVCQHNLERNKSQ